MHAIFVAIENELNFALTHATEAIFMRTTALGWKNNYSN